MQLFKLFILLLVIGVFSCKTDIKTKTKSNSTLDSLQTNLDSIAATNVLPGFAISVFTKDSIIYNKGFGYANLEDKITYSTNHIQIIASITKTLVGVSLMKLVEENKINLDDDINKYLPFKVINPNFPEDKITIRMLASHTSSIGDTELSDEGYRFQKPLKKEDFPVAYATLLNNYNKTDSIPLTTFLQRKLDPKEIWYEKEIFTSHPPGTNYEYSNLGVSLLAHIIELITETSLKDFSKNLVLNPLQMESSFWELQNIPKKRHIRYYNELKNVVPKYYIITYPDGGLYSSVEDMTIYLQEMMKGYDGEISILRKDSFREMMKKQFSGEELYDGICWDLSYDGLIGHAGNDFGTATLMYFSPKTGIGRILFTNITIENEEQEDAFYGIYNTLFAYKF